MRKPETEKMMATNAANRERYDAQTVQIDENWRIIRFDEFNWRVQRLNLALSGDQWQEYPLGGGYFGKLPDALKSIPSSMLNFEAVNTLASLGLSLNAISDKVDAAASRAVFAS